MRSPPPRSAAQSRKSARFFLVLLFLLCRCGVAAAVEAGTTDSYLGTLEDGNGIEGVATIEINTRNNNAVLKARQIDGTVGSQTFTYTAPYFTSAGFSSVLEAFNLRMTWLGDGTPLAYGSLSVSGNSLNGYNIYLPHLAPPPEMKGFAGLYAVLLAGGDQSILTQTGGILATGTMVVLKSGRATVTLNVLGTSVTGNSRINGEQQLDFFLPLKNGAKLAARFDFTYGKYLTGVARIDATPNTNFGGSLHLSSPVSCTLSAAPIPGVGGFGTEANFHLATTTPGNTLGTRDFAELSALPSNNARLQVPGGPVLLTLSRTTGAIAAALASHDPRSPAPYLLRGTFLPSLGNGFASGFVWRGGKIIGSFQMLPGWEQPADATQTP